MVFHIPIHVYLGNVTNLKVKKLHGLWKSIVIDLNHKYLL
jgi:hypothetical protein